METNHGPAPIALTLERTNHGIDGSIALAFGPGPAPERPLDDLVVDADHWSFSAMVESNVGPIFVEFTGARAGERVEGTFTTYVDGQVFASGTWWAQQKVPAGRR
jgi:hypothetical protein